MSSLQLTVPDMACSACAATITQAIHSLDPNATIETNLPMKWVRVESQASDGDVRQAIANAGYRPSALS